ncbi:hypothetical protein FA13DRAFT_1804881 [Coprinellus micaceus]|uniref:Uncharacterized protein n=1 Tax=Coprinellus micaceus TaxID=71717 RepID=A0A4Y7S417_COPMI|nr:hypothetical protein FA13DRAFT_1804881 [Coprinellus micaceus]
MHDYLVARAVQYTSLGPVRIGPRSDAAPPVIIWVGVAPGSISGERGVEIAVGLRALLLANDITDVHVEICESLVNPLAKMYKPILESDDTFKKQGTATLFFIDPTKPGKLFLIVPKHVVFCADEKEYFEDPGSASRKNVILCSEDGFEARIEDIEREISTCRDRIDRLRARLMEADEIRDPEEAEMERKAVVRHLKTQGEAIEPLEKFLRQVKRDWKDPKDRIIGHVVYSPPLVHSFGKDKFTLDLAVVEVHSDKVDSTNFVGNAIDLGDIDLGRLNASVRPSRVVFPGNRLLRLRDTLSIDEMRSHSSEDAQGGGPPTIVLKRGCTSRLTFGCLHNIRSVLRQSPMVKPTEYSREFAVLTRAPKGERGEPFSADGDSGSVVINSSCTVVGMVTSGAEHRQNPTPHMSHPSLSSLSI